jgi:Ca2+-binding RTX toxin-like protein
MFGDGADDAMYGDRDIPAWVLDDPTGAAVDTMNGGPGADHMEGDGGDDVMFGASQNDHMEGNNGDDTMYGESGDDNMIGGSDNNDSEPDTGETLMSGGLGNDVMTGDNASIVPGGYVGGRSVTLHDPTIGDADHMEGDDETDYMFGQVGGDEMWGDQGVNGPDLGFGKADYMEGNDGDDTMNGEEGNDDMVGGNSATNGAIVEFRIGTDAADVGETEMNGGPGNDWMAGYNSRMNRVLKGLGADALDIDPLELFDLAGVGNPAVLGSAHGGDTMNGDGGTDFMFGQGSNDTMSGGDLPDYMEGNDGNDTMAGNDGDDDMIGGGSALDGIMDRIRVGEGLHDEGETNMSGGDGADWMAGDNAFMNRVLFGEFDTPIDLFDVNSPDEALVSGGDTMEGNAGEDIMFGQGNGSQTNQSDPPDGNVDNDGDGVADEDAAWLGDTMRGGADDDYIEGNHGSDLIYGNGGNDDLIGGGSALDGLFIELRVGNGLQDERDTIYGNDGQDVVAGDNARINRTGEVTGLILPVSEDRNVTLFDVDSGDSAFSGGDFLSGGADDDLVFGQGNGGQSANQADPLDGVDNDFDGREGPDSTEYDCADNGFDNDGDGDADGADSDCQAAIDEDQPWDGDIMLGNGGDDYMEGNHGADWMFGGADEDDMIGGGSAHDGIIIPTREGTGLNDGPDVMHGEGDDDVMAGDNAWINRIANGAGTGWVRISTADVVGTPTAGYGPYDQAVRVTNMHDADAGADAHGNDYMTGGNANDEMYGQLGDDFVLGNLGDDALVGDLGQVRANVIGDDPSDPDPETIATQSPRWEDTIYELGSMWWETELYAYDTSAGGVGGADTLLGYDGRDTAFGGPGDDVINGDGDGVEEVFDTDNPEFTHITDVDGDEDNNDDTDMLFGGDDNDAIWGGRHNDILLGGHGADFLDVRPREETDNGRTGAKFRIVPRDRPAWFTWAFPENFQDVDFIYGGWDEDALQADQAANGPDPGDRLADWAGGYNVFYLCPAGYGDFTITRSGSPFVQRFIQDLAEASGAFDAATSGESGFRDVGFVFPSQRGLNSHPPHPDHPGHFTCADYTGVGSGLAVANIAGADSVAEGGSASLDGTASSGYGAVAFDWSVNPFEVDDTGSAAPTISAAGLDDGTVEIGLDVIDDDGAHGLAKTSIQVTNVAPAVVLNTMTATVDDGSAASLEAGYADPGVLDTHTAVIDWGDGSVCDTAVDSDCSILGTAGSGIVAGSHTYAGLGSYVVSVTVTDDDGGATTEELGAVEVVPPRVRAANTWIATDPWPADPLAIAGVDYGRDEAIGVMESGTKNERSGTLFRQLAAALLNAAHGTDTSCVDDALAAADAWLTVNPPGSGVKDNSVPWAEAQPLWSTMRDYNMGDLCVPAP